MYYGIDLGGTKIEGVVLRENKKEAFGYEIMYRHRVATQAEAGYHHIINRMKLLLGMMEKASGEKIQRVGIGTPGSLDPKSGKLKNSNSTNLNAQPFLADTKMALGCDVAMANDADCLALGEQRMGVAKGYGENKTVFGVIMGTGVGGGIIANGHLLRGSMGLSGEWGHNFLDESGGPCYCGKTGCVESILSGPGLERFYHKDRKTDMREIYRLYKTGKDEKAKATIERLCHFFGLAMSCVVNIVDPHIIILGGGVGNIDELQTSGLHWLKRYTFNTNLKQGIEAFHTVLVRPHWGDSAGVLGAAFL